MCAWCVATALPTGCSALLRHFEDLEYTYPAVKHGNGFGNPIPRCSMHGIFTYIWMSFGVNVDTYSIHGAYGICIDDFPSQKSSF